MKEAKQTNIVFILRTGGDFKLSDAFLLATHINKYWLGTIKPNIVCFTDKVLEESRLVGITLKPLPNKVWKGWWSKMNLFHPALRSLRPFLFMDLDTAVLGDLSKLIPPEEIADKFITLEDFYRKGKIGSALMWVPNSDKVNAIWDEWNAKPAVHITRYRGDQNFLENVSTADGFWQQMIFDKVTSFKPNKKWLTVLPSEAKIVCFHGKPRIADAAEKVEWVSKYVNYAI